MMIFYVLGAFLAGWIWGALYSRQAIRDRISMSDIGSKADRNNIIESCINRKP